jgi:hypothetical protein
MRVVCVDKPPLTRTVHSYTPNCRPMDPTECKSSDQILAGDAGRRPVAVRYKEKAASLHVPSPKPIKSGA